MGLLVHSYLSISLTLHLDIFTVFPKVLQQVAPLKVLVGVDNGFELRGCHDTVFFGAAHLVLMNVLKDSRVSSALVTCIKMEQVFGK